MGKKSTPAAPPPPDPVATAKAQGQMNKETAVATYGLQATNQNTPFGSVNYRQIGKWADGTPRFEATQSLSAPEMAKQQQQWEFDRLVNDLGINQTKRLQGHLDSPVSLNNEATEARLMELGRARLDPVMQQRRAALETQLYNQGVRPGTEAWTRAIGDFGQQENDAYNQLLLQGRGQAVQEALTARNQPINEITALMNGGQVTQPNFIGTPSPTVAPVDYTGLVSNTYNAQVAQHNAEAQRKAQQNSAMWGALGSIAGSALGGWGMGGFKGFG